MSHALLQTSDATFLLVQEPWYGRIQTSRLDSDPSGIEILGTTHNNLWESFLPRHSPTDRCKVAVFIKAEFARSFQITNILDHPLASPTSMVIDVEYGDKSFRIVNIYHSVPESGHGLSHVFSADLDDVTPTLMVGDFNTHSPTWSRPGATTSSWAARLEDWFEAQGLQLLNPPGEPTWCGREDQTPSVLDLVLLNDAASVTDQFSPLTIDFEASLDSDHAGMMLTWFPLEALALNLPAHLAGYAIDDAYQDAWIAAFRRLPLTPNPDTAETLDDAASQLHADINLTSSSLFSPRKAPIPNGVRWWSDECSAALALMRGTHGSEHRTHLKAFRLTVANARQTWADEYLDQAPPNRLWQAASWIKGRRVSYIPPIWTPEGLSHDNTLMSKAFHDHFFSVSPSPVVPSQPDDPPPLPPRLLEEVILEEISTALFSTSNKSAPGSSGINYKLLKWAFAASPQRFLDLFNAALTLGHHPWKEASVVVIPKLNKPDYSLPKAY